MTFVVKKVRSSETAGRAHNKVEQKRLFDDLRTGLIIRGLSLTRPCPFAFIHGPADERKGIENRKWKPPEKMIGQLMALHSSATYSVEYQKWIAERTGLRVPDKSDSPKSEIFAVCRLVGYVTSAEDERLPRQQRKWFLGPYAWLLDEIVPLLTPVACVGGQKLWRLESRPGVVAALKRSYREVTGEDLKLALDERSQAPNNFFRDHLSESPVVR